MKVTVTIFSILILIISQLGCNTKKSSDEQKKLTVFLVRHAEKMDFTEDPELSDIGKERALELVKILRSVSIDYVHSSNYIRTRETAKPTSEKFGITTEIYDPNKLEYLADKLMKKGGTHLVVGHSGSTPEMVSILGGDPVSEVNDEREYDRLYIVQVSEKNDVNSILMRYGSPYDEN